MHLSNKTYDFLKFVALIGLPALAVLYSGLGELWKLPNTDQIVGTIILLDTFLGALLQISTSKYHKNDDNYEGFLSSNGVHPDTGIPNLQLTVTKNPNDILSGKVARLRVVPEHELHAGRHRG